MTIKNILLSTAFVCGTIGASTTAHAGTDVFMGEVTIVGFNFCPRGYAPTDGQLLPIAQYNALFSLLGTMYGGDGRKTFGLPNFQSRAPIGAGAGNGLPTYAQGAMGGTPTNIMTEAQMPSHTHRAGLRTKNAPADAVDPTSRVFADTMTNIYASGPANGNFMDESTVQINPAGGSVAQNNMQPYIAMKYCIATEGIYPSRN